MKEKRRCKYCGRGPLYLFALGSHMMFKHKDESVFREWQRSVGEIK